MSLHAAIDLGTVTSRLMVAEVQQGRVSVLKRSTIITNLGEGLTQEGVISNEAYIRLLTALLSFKEEITNVKTQLLCEGRKDIQIPVKIVTTSAMRDAKNASHILSQLEDVGFDVEIISGAKEAQLSFEGTVSGFDVLEEPVMSIDVGGGSTELILGNSKGDIAAAHSFNIGSRRVTEMFLHSDPPRAQELEEMQSWIDAHFVPYVSGLKEQAAEVIAVAGAATSAIAIRDALDPYDSNYVHGQSLSRKELEDLIERLSLLDLEEREQVVGLEKGRAPVIVGGLVILLSALKATKKEKLFVSETDILQGIIINEETI